MTPKNIFAAIISNKYFLENVHLINKTEVISFNKKFLLEKKQTITIIEFFNVIHPIRKTDEKAPGP